MKVRTALTIAGSDSGGGAGIQADLKTFMDHDVYGMSVVTGLTAQNTQGVRRVELTSPEMVRDQLLAVFEDLPIHAIKTGMLGSAALIDAVCDVLEARANLPPIVVDPVMVAKGGASLLDPRAVDALIHRLIPLACITTPNLPELAVLGELSGTVLVKDGHGTERLVRDRLIHDGGITVYQHRRVRSRNTHGTGCTLSAAVAARLAHGDVIQDACRRSIKYVSGLIQRSRDSIGSGHGPLLHGLRSR